MNYESNNQNELLVSCEMDTILDIAKKHNLFVIEDAAQGMMSSYKGRALGTIGDFGAYSFHETKNYTMGEGGLIFVNREEYVHEAEIIREKGTNRSQYFRGEVDKYSWVDKGSSYLPSELNMAYLLPQLEIAEQINEHRLVLWQTYYRQLSELMEMGKIELPIIPKDCIHNAHMFYIKAADLEERTKLISFLQENVRAVNAYKKMDFVKTGSEYNEDVKAEVIYMEVTDIDFHQFS